MKVYDDYLRSLPKPPPATPDDAYRVTTRGGPGWAWRCDPRVCTHRPNGESRLPGYSWHVAYDIVRSGRTYSHYRQIRTMLADSNERERYDFEEVRRLREE